MSTDTCPHYAKTGLKVKPGGMENTCRTCPLRGEKGHCIQDIIDDMSEKVGENLSQAQFEIGAIWRQYERNKG